MAGHIRTSNCVANLATRVVKQAVPGSMPATVALSSTSPLGLGPIVAHGRAGSEQTTLTVSFRSDISASAVVSCWIYEPFGTSTNGLTGGGEWFKAGANNGVYQKTFEPSGKDVFVVPENCLFYLQLASGGPVGAGQCFTDGTDPPNYPMSY
jgi:hypothetical protein